MDEPQDPLAVKMPNLIPDWKKKRLYIAFYGRNPSPDQDIPFHTALLLTPKKPSTKRQDTDSMRFHTVNKITRTERGAAITPWAYEAEETIARTRHLAAAMFIGKVSRAAEAELGRILGEVPIVQDDDNWWCCNWIWSALQVCRSIATRGDALA